MLSQELKEDRGDIEQSLMGKSKVSIMLGNNSKLDMSKSKQIIRK
jgi:IS1 family transposase